MAAWLMLSGAIVSEVVADVVFFDQRLSMVQVGGLLLVVLGVAALELGGAKA